MALNGLFCADVPLRNYSLSQSLTFLRLFKVLFENRFEERLIYLPFLNRPLTMTLVCFEWTYLSSL